MLYILVVMGIGHVKSIPIEALGSSTPPRLSMEEGDGVIQRLFQRVEGLFDLQALLRTG